MEDMVEEAAARKEQGTEYKIIKNIGDRCHTTNTLIKDKNGSLLTSERREQEICWMEYLGEVLNRPPPENCCIKYPGNESQLTLILSLIFHLGGKSFKPSAP